MSAPPALDAIEQTPLRVQVAKRLRSAIVTGRLRPGTALVETALAEQLNVSRAPVREAIQDLEYDGLVETVAYKGKRVKPFTRREVVEIADMRRRFEVMAVGRVLGHGTSVAPLWAPCRAMDAAADAYDRDGLIAADDAFHRALIRLSDHELLASLWARLHLRVRQIMAIRSDPDENLADIARAHPPIVRALEAGDAERATRLVSAHASALADLGPTATSKSPE